jgi:replicative DNA helicase
MAANITSRVPPKNLDAEKSCLGCQMLVERDGNRAIPRELERLNDVLSIDDYASDSHQSIQRAIWASRERNDGNTDVLLVAEELERMGLFEAVGGDVYLADILSTVPHSGHVLYYASIIRDCSKRRLAIEIFRSSAMRAYTKSEDIDEVVNEAIESLRGIMKNNGTGS